MKMNKKAKLDISTTMTVVYGVIGIVILFAVVGSLFPTLVTSGLTLNQSGFPLASLFAKSTSAGWYILAAVVIIAVFGLLQDNNK